MRVALVSVSFLSLTLGGCGISVTPPEYVLDPVDVYVADHGIHTSLVFPREDGRLTQFTYSRYDWAALDQDQWYRSLPALMIPGPGTIGTRDFPGPATEENLAHQFALTNHDPPMQSLYAVPVSRERCREVVDQLQARWDAARDTAVYNEKRGMTFVRDSTQYSIFHNCNKELAGWLRDLGCEVGGATVTADVSVREGSRPAPHPTDGLMRAAHP